ncbi:hypothetical protein ACLK1S_25440 [Escherichia coli]
MIGISAGLVTLAVYCYVASTRRRAVQAVRCCAPR